MRSQRAPLLITQAGSGSDYAAARRLFEEYAAQLGIDLCFQGFGAELNPNPGVRYMELTLELRASECTRSRDAAQS